MIVLLSLKVVLALQRVQHALVALVVVEDLLLPGSKSHYSHAFFVDDDKIVVGLKHGSLYFRLPQLEALVSVDDKQVFFLAFNFGFFLLDCFGRILSLEDQDVKDVDVGSFVTNNTLFVIVFLVVEEHDVRIFKVQFVALPNNQRGVEGVSLCNAQHVEAQLAMQGVGADVEALVLALVVHLLDVLKTVMVVNVEHLIAVCKLPLEVRLGEVLCQRYFVFFKEHHLHVGRASHHEDTLLNVRREVAWLLHQGRLELEHRRNRLILKADSEDLFARDEEQVGTRPV